MYNTYYVSYGIVPYVLPCILRLYLYDAASSSFLSCHIPSNCVYVTLNFDHIMLSRTALYHIVSYCVISYRIELCLVESHRFTSYHIILHRMIL